MIVPGLDSILHSLLVDYRASAEPQILTVHIEYEGQPIDAPGALLLPFLVDAIGMGAAAGADFEPRQGRARITRSRTGEALPNGRLAWTWEVEVAAMAPLYLRALVERLAIPEDTARVVALEFRGSITTDDSPLSVRSADVVRWVDDDDAYPAFRPPPFQFEERPIHHGASMRLRLDGVPTLSVMYAFQRLIGLWSQVSYSVINSTAECQGIADVTAAIARGANELCACYDVFDYSREPVRASLLNMLNWFHHSVMPIRHLDLALP